MTQFNVLVVDDEEDIRLLLQTAIERMGYATTLAGGVTEAKTKMGSESFDLVLTDMKMPDGEGFELVEYCQSLESFTPCAVITAHGSMDMAIEALKRGAFDFVSKPIAFDKLQQLIEAAIAQPTPPRSTIAATIIGHSTAITQLRSRISKLAKSLAPIYISGESGTGKELVARALHSEGARSAQPFIPVNCGAIPSELMESEFFGHLKGAFTGANSNKPGLFVAASGGTLFLDEVADLPMDMQVKLLRAIQERSVRPIGGEQEVAVDVRILCATHKPLAEEVEAGRFRQDLYYRLNVIEMQVPPLRDRTEDLELLWQHFLERFSSRWQLPKPRLSDGARRALNNYRFPGNVRELENILERAYTLCENNEIVAADLGLNQLTPPKATQIDEVDNLEAYLADIERSVLIKALDACHGNRTAAAKKLGISFRSIRYRLERLNINVDEIVN